MTPLYFFHGTHAGNLPRILTEGIRPQKDPSSEFRGNFSTIPGYTEDLVFLAPSLREAAFYAREQSKYSGMAPVIFQVAVSDHEKLHVSDDYRLSHALDAMLTASGLPMLEYDDDGDVHEYGRSSGAYYAWREILSLNFEAASSMGPLNIDVMHPDTKSLLADIDGCKSEQSLVWRSMCLAFVESINHPWQCALATDRDPAAGFAGIIPASDLIRVNEADLEYAIFHIRRGTGIPLELTLETPLYSAESMVARSYQPKKRTP